MLDDIAITSQEIAVLSYLTLDDIAIASQEIAVLAI